MMGRVRNILAGVAAFSLVACGGGGSGGSFSGSSSSSSSSSGGTGNSCTLSARQDFVKQALEEWYLFPDLLDSSVSKSAHSDLQSYIDALVAPARAQSKDRYFTYLTSIAEENAYYNSGSTAGFGIRLAYDTVNNRVFVIEAFETAPAYPEGFDRGTEILSVGTSASTLQSISSLMASGGPSAVIDALGPSDSGVTRVFDLRQPDGSEQQVTVSKADYSIDPMSNRYGAKIIDDGGKKVGYVNLRTFINTAEPDLAAAFDNFRQQGVSEIIVDVRYNGGGLVTVANYFGDMMGKANAGQLFGKLVHRPSKAEYDEDFPFHDQPEAITATKIAFIGTRGSASASELIQVAFIPYLGNNLALVGTNTYGKPVGQSAFDLADCDDRLRAVTFKTVNRDGLDEYYTGLASVMPNTCAAEDDIFTPLGDPNEASVAQALSFLRGGAASCTPISAGAQGTQAVGAQREVFELLQPRHATTAQIEVPGLF